jgi:hypothetical protein
LTKEIFADCTNDLDVHVATGRVYCPETKKFWSGCQEVGDLAIDEPAAPLPDVKRLAIGDQWFCNDGTRQGCYRTSAECKTATNGTCTARATATCWTWDSEGRPKSFCGVDAASCEFSRSHGIGQLTKNRSRCGEVGGTEPDAELVAKKAADEQAAAKKRAADQAAAKKTADDDEAAKKLKAQQRADRAAAHYKQGKAHFDEGGYAAAATEYEAAYALDKITSHLFNIGEAHRLGRKLDKALEAYQRYIDADPKGDRVNEARRNIAKVTKELGGKP